MLKEWLEPAIEKRVWEVVGICEEENKHLYDEFSIVLNRLKKHVSLELIDDLNKMEDIFLQKGSAVKTAYEAGFNDAFKLNKEMKELM